MKLPQRMISRRWLLTTILVLVAMAVMARLGVWQLDRLAQRRAFNARVLAQIDQPELVLRAWNLDEDLYNMEYRHAAVAGEYDPSQEIAIRNQVWEGRYGVHLLTPLQITGSDQAVLVDRGWIPIEDFESGDWSKYNEPGQITVHGIIRRPQSKADLSGRSDPTPAPGQAPLLAWTFVNISAIQSQVNLPLLPVYIQQAPDPSWTSLPHRTLAEVEISEGPHMGYALQWFIFAAILGIGYPVFIRRQEKKSQATVQPRVPGMRTVD